MKENLPITLVTSSTGNRKEPIFRAALPHFEITRKDPTFDEARIQQMAPHTEYRPVYIAEEKAREDAAWVTSICGTVDLLTKDAKEVTAGKERIFMYTDSVQVVHEDDGSHTVLEKPTDEPHTWAHSSEEAMRQSGKVVELVNAITVVFCDGSKVSEPKTIIIRAQATMRPYTRADLHDYATTHPNSVSETAGGISLTNGGRHLYDVEKPLVVTYGYPDGTETLYKRYETWHKVSSDELRPYICGAVEPAIREVIASTAG